MLRIHADIGAVMPAAFALGVGARGDDDCQAFAGTFVQGGTRSDEYIFQVVPQPLERLVRVSRSMDVQLGLQGRTQQALRAFLLDLLVGDFPDIAHVPPGILEFAIHAAFRQNMPQLFKYAPRVFSRVCGPYFFRGEAQDGGYQTDQAVDDLVQGILRGSARK